MSDIILTNHSGSSMTVVSNTFIDYYMPHASGEFVKIYLYLLRLASAGRNIALGDIANHLRLSKDEIDKGLLFWQEQGLVHLTRTQSGDLLSLQLLPVSDPAPDYTEELSTAKETAIAVTEVPAKKSYTPKQILDKTKDNDLSQIIYITETYLKKPLSSTDLNIICYIYDTLEFSPDLLEYLIEHCVSLGKKSLRYIETVAISWYQEGIDSKQKAKAGVSTYNKNYFSVLKAFGISGRNPGQVEADFIKKWIDGYGFSLDIILEACNRTLTNTGQPSFPYADRILADWSKQQVRSKSDIDGIDAIHRTQNKKHPATQPAKSNAAPNKFHNFEQRTYDYEDLEKRFLQKTYGDNEKSR